MKKLFLSFILSFSLILPLKAFAFWGNPADTAYLAQIFINAVKQLKEMQQVVGQTRDSLALARDLNRGINEVLNLMQTAFPESELGIYKDWNSLQMALQEMQSIYGTAMDAKEFAHQGHLDQSIAEAILLYNKLTEHAKRVDAIGENVKSQSRYASPKGAARLQAQMSGVKLHVANQSLRTQGAILKLQAQNSAMANKKEKDETRFFIESANKLKEAMKNHEPSYETPRF